MIGLKRSAAHEAARRGEIPVIKIGRRRLVPAERWDRILRGEEPVPSFESDGEGVAGE